MSSNSNRERRSYGNTPGASRSTSSIKQVRSPTVSIKSNAFNNLVNELNRALSEASFNTGSSIGSPVNIERTNMNKHFAFAEKAAKKSGIKIGITPPRRIRSPVAKISPSKRVNYLRGELSKFGRVKNAVTLTQLENAQRLVKSKKELKPGGVITKVFIDHRKAFDRIKKARYIFVNKQKRSPNRLRVSPNRSRVRRIPTPPRVRKPIVSPIPKPKSPVRISPVRYRPVVTPPIFHKKPAQLFNIPERTRKTFESYMMGKNLSRTKPRNILRNLGNTPNIRRLIAREVDLLRWKRKVTAEPEVPVETAYERKYKERIAQVPRMTKRYVPKVVEKERVELPDGPEYTKKPEAWKLVQEALGSTARVRKIPKFMVEPIGLTNRSGNPKGRLFWINDAGTRHPITETRMVGGIPHVVHKFTRWWKEKGVEKSKQETRLIPFRHRAPKTAAPKATEVGVVRKAAPVYNMTKRFGSTTHRRLADKKNIYITNRGAFRTAIGTGGAAIDPKYLPADLVKLVEGWKKNPDGKTVYEYLVNKNYQVPN